MPTRSNLIMLMRTLTLSTLVLAGLNGCASIPEGQVHSDVSFMPVVGISTVKIDRPLDEVFEATRNAMDDLGFVVIKSIRDEIKGVIESREVDGSTNKTTIHRLGDHTCKVDTYVGPLGSASKAKLISQTILSRIDR